MNKNGSLFNLIVIIVIAIIAAACVSNNTGASNGEITSQNAAIEFNLFVGYYHDLYIDQFQVREVIYYGSGRERVYFYCDVDLYEFKILAVGTDEELNFFAERTVFSVDVFSSNAALEYQTYIPEGIPAEAVSFKTADGTAHAYLLGSSGVDGSVAVMRWNNP